MQDFTHMYVRRAYKNKYYKHREETINDIFHTFGTINDVVQKELNNK